MTIGRSRAYDRIHDETWKQYKPNEEEHKEMHPSEVRWAKTVAPKWVARVGLPRLIAEAVLAEASGLLRSLNPGLFRNDAEGRDLLAAASNAASELYGHVAVENWRRFDAKERKR